MSARRAAFVAIATLAIACGATRTATPPPSAPARESTCTPEALTRATRPPDAGVIVQCKVWSGVCGSECAPATRACILDAVRDAKPFDAIWTGNYRDGTGQRYAVTARGEGDSYRVTWLDYAFTRGDDASHVPSRERVFARDCAPLVDLRAECAPGGPQRLCDSSLRGHDDFVALGCAGPERVVCDETVH